MSPSRAWGTDVSSRRQDRSDSRTFDSTCLAPGNIDHQTILQRTAEHEIGWYAWEWGPGNGFGGPGCDIMDMTPDGRFANLKAGWATEVATTSQYSIANNATSIL